MEKGVMNFQLKKGFTLTELLTVMTVMGVLFAFAVPAVISYLPKYRLQAVANRLFSNLQRVKQEAVRINGECAIYFDAENNQYQLISGGLNKLCDGQPMGLPPKPQNDDILIHQVLLSNYGSGIRYGTGTAQKTVPGKKTPPEEKVSYANDWVRFDGKGMARDMGYIYLTNENGDSFAVGTPSFVGAIVQKKWMTNGWQ
jgi:prepilin-type N-terminal cleavage/methylation domain-containing protein